MKTVGFIGYAANPRTRPRNQARKKNIRYRFYDTKPLPCACKVGQSTKEGLNVLVKCVISAVDLENKLLCLLARTYI